jgi:hypothetical protein
VIYPIGGVITRIVGSREVVIASAGKSRKTFGIEHQARRVGNAVRSSVAAGSPIHQI